MVRPWWTPPPIHINPSAKEAIREHEATKLGTIRIYTDGSGINGHIDAAAATLAPPENRVRTKRLEYMGTSTTSTVYAAELKGLVLALQIVRHIHRQSSRHQSATRPQVPVWTAHPHRGQLPSRFSVTCKINRVVFVVSWSSSVPAQDLHLFIAPGQVNHLGGLMAVLKDAVGTCVAEPVAQYDTAAKRPTVRSRASFAWNGCHVPSAVAKDSLHSGYVVLVEALQDLV